MKKLNASIIKFAVVLQLLILLFAAVAVSSATPQLPILAEGEVELDGVPVDSGTVITVKFDGKTVGTATVSNNGVYGDKQSNLLTIPEADYTKFKFYVNDIESSVTNPDEIMSAEPGDIIKLDLQATTPVRNADNGEVDGFGGGRMAAPSDDDSGAVDESPSVPSDETVLPSPGSESDVGSDESMPVPNPESQSTLVFGLVLLLFVALVGIGALKYKNK